MPIDYYNNFIKGKSREEIAQMFKELDDEKKIVESELAECQLQLETSLKKLDNYQDAMEDAIDNCETCRGEENPNIKCCRCETFIKLLEKEI